MKIVVTGSLGNISKPLTETLLQKGHAVTVISSDAGKQQAIVAMGATAAIGSVTDSKFLTAAFTGADAVYCMIPPPSYFNHDLDLEAYCLAIASNYIQAIQQSGVKRVIHLSSIGAHLEKGSGIIRYYHTVEGMLGKLADVGITFMRPTAFYYNLYGYTDMIKKQGFIAANYGGADKIVWVSPVDIAAAIAGEITTPFTGKKVQYVASEELSGDETAAIIGTAIGKPDLKWLLIPGEEMQSGLEAAGMAPQIAAGLVEMYASLHSGAFSADYYLNKPAVMGKVKLQDFAKEFAAAFNQQQS